MKRIYVIADDYRWHHIVEDPKMFAELLSNYAELMRDSKKENTFKIFTIDDMTDGEIRSARQMIDKRKEKARKSRLELLK